ncbi:DUF4174 domain-containing protein [Litorimonas cladophorae]|uniref:DUF4174 domain-containing protein n=1 Tax=Litorimonas cladophorae TaxID=1220491 RepID=UPI00167803F7|nr:DUF4174 domain-containing protein [Litorimonas cladophorae]
MLPTYSVAAETSKGNVVSLQDAPRILAFCDNPASDQSLLLAERVRPTIDWVGFNERDLVLVEVIGDTTHPIISLKDGQRDRVEQVLLNDFQPKEICREDFEFVLIGRDGAVKKRWQKFLSVEDLFQTIDAMPMRRFEIMSSQRSN